MSISRTLVSFYTALTNDEFTSDHLKLCFLWYDEVLFEDLGRFSEDRFFETLVGEESNSREVIKDLSDIIRPLSKRVSENAIGNREEIFSEGYPRWKDEKYYTYPSPENASQFAHNCLLTSIEQEWGGRLSTNPVAVNHAEGRARVAVNGVKLWERVNAELPCMFQASSDEKLAMLAARQFSFRLEELPTPFSLFEIAVPSLATVSWPKVIGLRRDGAIDSLRKKIAQIHSQVKYDLEAGVQMLEMLEAESMGRIFGKARPNVKKVAIESLLANIPGLPVNPFSMFFGLRDTLGAVKDQNDLGWFYLLRDLKNAADEQR
jgi:hypothetical protein